MCIDLMSWAAVCAVSSGLRLTGSLVMISLVFDITFSFSSQWDLQAVIPYLL
jgi:hypothetical protein